MSQDPTTVINERKRPISYPKGTIKFLGTGARGLQLILPGNLETLSFPDLPGTDKFVKRFDMDNPVQRKQFEAAIESKPFIKGQIHYIESPEELQKKAKMIKQEETLKTIKASISSGIFLLSDLKVKSVEELIELADSIGAECEYVDPRLKILKHLRKEVVVKNIYDKLGIEKRVDLRTKDSK